MFVVLLPITACYIGLCTGFLSDTPRIPLRVAAFNIKTFGQAKMSDSSVVNNIVKILHRYDIVLIQEVHDSSGAALKSLQTHLSSDNTWAFVSSVPVGRTSYKEQYVFFYQKKSLNVVGQQLYNDSAHDYFEREPFSIEVQYYSVAKAAVRHIAFLGLHTRPEDTSRELEHLSEVIKTVSNHFSNADGVIAMGDFNADCSYLSATRRRSLDIFTPSSGFKSYIPDSADTTVAHTTDCAYDRVIALGNVDIRAAQPYNFETGLALTTAAASNVSDHYPVEFSLY